LNRGCVQAAAATYLAAPFGLTKALDKGAIQPYLKSVKISRNNARRVAALTLDTSGPTLINFDLNVGTGVLSLNFDEPVTPTSVQLVDFTVLSASLGVGTTFIFSPLSTSLVNDSTVQVVVGTDDMNNVKLAVSGSSCASLAVCTQIVLDSLLVAPNAAYDLYNNYLPGNDLRSLIPVRTFIPDTVPPMLQTTVLDLSAGTITISFNEVVRLGSFYPYDLTIYSGPQMNTSFSLTVRRG